MSNDCGPGRIEFEPGASVTPKKLPTHGLAPVALTVHGKIATENGGHPSALREAIVDNDAGIAIDTAGLSACGLRRLEGHGAAAARRLCRGSIVGSGIAHIGFASSGTTVEAPLTLFNGGTSDGETRLFIQATVAIPDPIPVVGTVKVQRKYSGLHAILKIPRILEGDGSLLDFRVKIKRHFMSRGAEHSYLSASCSDGVFKASVKKLLFRNEAKTPGVGASTTLKGNLAVPCTPTQ